MQRRNKMKRQKFAILLATAILALNCVGCTMTRTTPKNNTIAPTNPTNSVTPDIMVPRDKDVIPNMTMPRGTDVGPNTTPSRNNSGTTGTTGTSNTNGTIAR